MSTGKGNRRRRSAVAAAIGLSALTITVVAGADQAHAALARPAAAAATVPTWTRTIGHVGDAFVYPWGMATEPAVGGPWGGDIIVGDRDGVVAIPLAQATHVVGRLELVKKKEAEAEAKVKKGVKLKFWDPDALGSRVHYID